MTRWHLSIKPQQVKDFSTCYFVINTFQYVSHIPCTCSSCEQVKYCRLLSVLSVVSSLFIQPLKVSCELSKKGCVENTTLSQSAVNDRGKYPGENTREGVCSEDAMSLLCKAGYTINKMTIGGTWTSIWLCSSFAKLKRAEIIWVNILASPGRRSHVPHVRSWYTSPSRTAAMSRFHSVTSNVDRTGYGDKYKKKANRFAKNESI